MSNDNDIAVVGMALRVPGAANPREFWRNLRDGVESVRSYTDEELLASGERQDLIQRPNYVKAGAPLDRMEFFDSEFFGFSPKESAILDPQHRQFFECVWEALEDSAHAPESFSGRVGVFAGSGMGSYFYFNLCTNPELVSSVGMFLLRHTGNDKDFLATRVSYLFDLRGPSISIQTACSTSLVAVHLACQSLLAGECDMALAGGVTIELPHRRGYLYQEREILSPDGHCRAFDARAEGTVFGSGVGVVVLRRLQDAIADRDAIYAVIKGSAVNNDGSTKAGYLAPSVEGQASAIAEALLVANVSAESVDYVECHGTGTYLGDPIEIAALTQAFRETTQAVGSCKIGSVKTNIGHTDTAAGVLSLIKVCLALKHRQIPPSLNFQSPNPMIDFASSPFGVADRLSAWPRRGTPRRATVNSLGVGGTNAHAVIEEAPELSAPAGSARRWQILAFSARNRAALDAQCDALARHLEEETELSLADVSYTLLEGRRRFEQRRTLCAATHQEAIELLRSRDARRVFTHTSLGENANLVFMFPGGGVQYPNMARGLFESEPEFREIVERGLSQLGKLVDTPYAAHLHPEASALDQAIRELLRPSVQLPLIFIIEYALARLWMLRGVEPRALVGHSLGEYTAACLAEVMTFEETIGLVLLRGQLFESVSPGGMLSVTASAQSLAPLLGDDLDLACVNAAELSVISGSNQALERLERLLGEQSIEFQRIPIQIAAHSRMLESILEPFRSYLRGLRLQKPKLPFVSNRTGTWITDQEATSPDYWVNHLRHTVRFADCLATLAEDGARIFLEVGPGRVLGSFAKQLSHVKPQSVLPSLRHQNEEVDDAVFFATVEGRLWALGLRLDPERLWPGQPRRRLSLPTYPFQGQSYWIPPGNLATAARSEEGLPIKEREFSRWFFHPRFQEREADSGEMPKQTWLLFMDSAGVGAGLLRRLRDRGHEVIQVVEGDAFYKLDDYDYRLSPEQGSEGYDALVRELLASGKVPNQVVHLWLLTERETFRGGSSFFHRNLEDGFFSLLFLAQALGGHDYPKPLHLTVAMNGVLRVRGEPVTSPSKAAALGPACVIPRELEGVTCRVIDVPLPAEGLPLFQFAPVLKARRAALRILGETNGFSNGSPGSAREAAIEAIERELAGAAASQIVCVRDGRRFVLGYQRAVPEVLPSPGFRERGVYLITGGFGGIGLSVARHLAAHYKARLVLMSRTPLPARERFDEWLKHRSQEPTTARIRQVLELEALGAEVLAEPADVTDMQRVRDVVEMALSRFGELHGVIHAAGTLRDAPMLGKQMADIEAVFAPKIYGTLVLDEVLKDRPLDFMLLFSSTSSAIAPPGQADYVAANAFLNAFAERASSRGRRVIALGWGIWRDVGIAADADRRLSAESSSEAHSESIQQPMVTTRRRFGTDAIHFEGTWSTRTQWVLEEHRTANGEALLPGTGYIELIREVIAEITAPQPFEIADLFFFRPLHVPDGHQKQIRVVVKPDERGYEVEVLSSVQTEGARSWERHAQALVSLVRLEAEPPLDLARLLERCTNQRKTEEPGGLRTRQEQHLRFGKRWRVISMIAEGAGEAVARLELPEAFVPDLSSTGLHPAVLDMATGFALELASSYGSGSTLWVPVSYQSVRVYGTFPKLVWSWARITPSTVPDAQFVSFDITITDQLGTPLVVIKNFTMKRLSDPMFAVPRAPTASELVVETPVAATRELTQAELTLRHLVSQGITKEEGMRALEQVVGSVPGGQVLVSSMDLAHLIRAVAPPVRESAKNATKFSRPQLDTEYAAPEGDIERTLVEFWEELLGVNNVGVLDSFFDLGGHSLVAVRLFAKIRKTYNVDYPISVLFEAPTIRQCAAKLREAVDEAPRSKRSNQQPEARTRYLHLVSMHPRGEPAKVPFFLVAGMFGNVLNLRHLAHLVGADRPFYGLQARGLYGDHQPHETFEEMARDYLNELRTVQPRGPYLLGGFSGGGITAYEMARQLLEEGEQVAMLVMLDTPLPNRYSPTLIDRIAIQLQNLKQDRAQFLINWARGKLEYRRRVEEREKRLRTQQQGKSHDFHSQVIESAFYRALEVYRPVPLDVTIALFRPKLSPKYLLPNGTRLNHERRPIFSDNGWTPLVRHVEVCEVPGDHDSMVLEPNVRVLAARLRDILVSAEPEPQGGPRSQVHPVRERTELSLQ